MSGYSAAVSVCLISGRRVVVAPDEPVIDHGGVLVENGVISAVGPAAELARDGVEHRAHPGATVLPGLINAHAHLAFDVTRDPVPALRDADHDALRATIETNASAHVEAGITTVRDLGDRDGLVALHRDRVASGVVPGPRIVTAGAPLTPPGGHCWFLGGEVRPAEVRAAVAARAASGLDVVKVMASGGNLTPSGPRMWESQFGLAELRVVVDAAHEAGLPVAAHAHGTESIARAARAGVDTIEHAGWQAAGGERDCSDEVADLVAASGAAIVPTRFRGWRDWPPEAGLEAHLERQRWVDRHGIRTIVGNDAGVGKGYFDDLHDAMTFDVAAGWTPARVLAATTSGSAAALGIGDRVGRLAPGFVADVLVVDGDPLDDLDALRRVRLVLAGGVPIEG